MGMKHLALMLEMLARAWLNQLTPASIYCREDLARVLIKTFEGTCKRLAGLTELQHCVHKPNETLREYIQHWTTLHHVVENITEHQAVCAFKAVVRDRELILKFGGTEPLTMRQMMEIATRYANGEQEDCLRNGKGKTTVTPRDRRSRRLLAISSFSMCLFFLLHSLLHHFHCIMTPCNPF